MDQKTVLYVEDEQDDVFFMQMAFKQAGPGIVLKTVGDGKQAMAYLSGTDAFDNRAEFPFPEVLLVDLNLPLISGFELLKWVRQTPDCRSLPVVIFSSSGRAEDRSRAQQLGANDYMLKPASGLEFVEFARRFHKTWLNGHEKVCDEQANV